MKQFVRIQSDKNVFVSASIQGIDHTNKDAHVPDRFRVAPAWVGSRILIKKGPGYYPAEIVNWIAVESLVRDGHITIGGIVEDVNDPEANEMYDNLQNWKRTYEQKVKEAKTQSANASNKGNTRTTKATAVKTEEVEGE